MKKALTLLPNINPAPLLASYIYIYFRDHERATLGIYVNEQNNLAVPPIKSSVDFLPFLQGR